MFVLNVHKVIQYWQMESVPNVSSAAENATKTLLTLVKVVFQAHTYLNLFVDLARCNVLIVLPKVFVFLA